MTLTLLEPAPTESPLDSLAGLLRALSDPLRLVILRVLARDSFGVLELCQLLDMKQPALSHHLKVLNQAGLLTTRRERTTVYYRRSALGVTAGSLSQRVLEALDALPLPADVLARLRAVQASRSAASQEFFRLNAGRFAAQQELIAGFADYGAASVRHAAELALASATVLEIGPGTGELLPLLAAHFEQVLGLDNSSEMLAKAASRVETLPRVQLLAGDTTAARRQGVQAEVVIMNMVLHHVPEPEAVLADVAALLKAGGALVLTELCEHEQAWAREACGDVWLGFAPEQLSQWTAACGLREGRADYLALKNGFRIQIREFIKD
jgi:ArsR family transcriptional regulator